MSHSRRSKTKKQKRGSWFEETGHIWACLLIKLTDKQPHKRNCQVLGRSCCCCISCRLYRVHARTGLMHRMGQNLFCQLHFFLCRYLNVNTVKVCRHVNWLTPKTNKKKPQGIFLHMTNCLIQKNKKKGRLQLQAVNSRQQCKKKKTIETRSSLCSRPWLTNKEEGSH